MVLIFAKILSVFGITFIGFGANKIKWLPSESTKYLSVLLVNIASPCLIISSMSHQEMTGAALSSVKQVAFFMLLALITATVISVFTVKLMKVPFQDRGIYRTVLVLTNNGFMGYPLSFAVFGQKGLFLMIVANAVFTIYLYSAGVILMTYDKEGKMDMADTLKSIISIPVVSSVVGLLIFIFSIPMPSILGGFFDSVGGMTIPLSMLIIGIQLAESKAREVLTNRHLFYTLILRLLVFPVVLFGIFMWFPFDPFVFCIVISAMTMPSAAVIPVLAEIHQTNAKLAAQAVFITTMFSLITIPVFGVLLTLYLGS